METLRSRDAQKVEAYAAKLAESRAAIEASQGADTAEIARYLSSAVWMVYKAKCIANSSGHDQLLETNGDLTRLVGLGYLREWPANPLNDWQPMRVSDGKGTLAPGDLVLELCPASEQTTTRTSGPIRGSFNLYVLGMEGTPREMRNIVLHKGHESWATVPDLAQYSVSFHMRSDREKAEEDRVRAAARAVQGNPDQVTKD